MASADKIKSLIKSFADNDEERFFTTALQIAASEAKKGHSKFANDLKNLIDKAKIEKASLKPQQRRVLPINKSKRDLENLVEIIKPQIKLKDMVLRNDVSASIARIIKEQRKADNLRKHNLEPRSKFIFIGPPGSGKTMTSMALAGELGLPLFVVKLDGIISKFMGESIVKLKLIFDSMYQYKAVYLFDEFDSIGSKRTMLNDVGEARRILNSFLINIENNTSQSIIIAATNLGENLDTALFRRFDDVIYYQTPEINQIRSLLSRKLKNYKFTKDFTISTLAKKLEGSSFADISKGIDEAVKEMIIENKKNVSLTSLLTYVSSRTNNAR